MNRTDTSGSAPLRSANRCARFLRTLGIGLTAGFVAVLNACGGGGSDAPGPIAGGGTSGTGAPITSSGAMLRGSVIVNGIRFDDSTATVLDDRSRGITGLANGMVVKLRGRANDDGVNGTAEIVKIENEVRGVVTSVNAAANPQSFVVGSITVLVDDTTVYANLANFAAIVAGTSYVEVHGLRDATGTLRASRVEGQTRDNANPADELRGTVSNLAPGAFNLGSVVVSHNATTAFSPTGTSAAQLANGTVVEVRGAFTAASTFTATAIDFEDQEDDARGLRGNSGEKSEIEGFITGFSMHPGTFKVGSRTVQTTAATQFVGGSSVDLANNVEVEVEGQLSGTTLVATKIKFERTRVILTGVPTAVNIGVGTLTVFGKTVTVNNLTDLRTSLANITPNVTRVEVRAFTSATGTLLAERVEQSNSGGGRDIVQARVSTENESSFTLALLGDINAALGGAGVQFRDTGDNPITRAQFFAAVTPAGATSPGNLVKVKGSFAGGTLTAEEAEMEN